MKVHLIICFVLLSIFITACQTQDNVVCNKPYIRVSTTCCLDTNDNKICDVDEKLIPNASGSQKVFYEVPNATECQVTQDCIDAVMKETGGQPIDDDIIFSCNKGKCEFSASNQASPI